MACPSCGCRVHYPHDDEDEPYDDRLQRCAACGEVFDLDDADDDGDDDMDGHAPPARALRRRCRAPELRKRVHPDPHDPAVLVGPAFDLPRNFCVYYGPRHRIGGRWVNALRASSLMYAPRHLRRMAPAERRRHKLRRLQERLAERIGLHRHVDLPF